jgi:hypothetical protein
MVRIPPNACARLRSVIAIAAVLAYVPSYALAQSVGSQRGQGLFGGVRPDNNAKSRLDLSVSVVEGYDSDVPSELRPTLDPSNLQPGGYWTMLDAGLAYAWRGRGAQFGANAASILRHYAEIGEVRSLGHSTGLGVIVDLPRRTALLANQSVAYSPTYLSGLFPTGAVVEPGDPGTTAPNYSVGSLESYAYTTTMAVRHELTRRSNVTLSADYTYQDRLNESDLWNDVDAKAVQGEFARNIGRNTALRAQYRYRAGQFGYAGTGKTIEHAADLGVSYSRRLSGTRQATLRFNLGPSSAVLPEALSTGIVTRRQYRAAGEASFAYEFGQSWQARVNYKRGLEYIVDLPEPVFADGASVGVDGLVSRRVDLVMSAGYSSGESLLNRENLLYDTYTGQLRVRYAFGRPFAVFAEYLYYYYSFRGNTQLREGLPPGLERSGVRAGLTLWVPAMRR